MVLKFDEGGGRTPESHEASDALRRRVAELEAEVARNQRILTAGGSQQQQANAWLDVFNTMREVGIKQWPGWGQDKSGREVACDFVRFLAGQSKECEQFRAVLHQGRRIPDAELMQDPAFLAFALARLEAANAGLRQELNHVLSAEFRAEVEKARTYRGGCRFCGWQWDWVSEQARQDGLNAHMDACEKAPIPVLRKRIAELEELAKVAYATACDTRSVLEHRFGVPKLSSPNCDLLALEEKARALIDAKESP
jgi:hypothetical protein